MGGMRGNQNCYSDSFFAQSDGRNGMEDRMIVSISR